MTQSPAFQFYPDDFLGSGKVGMMTLDEIGVYMLLLCLDWNETGFELDTVLLARWCRTDEGSFKGAWVMVGRCFVEKGGRWFNPRLEQERAKQAEWRAKSRAGGLNSGRARAKAFNHPSTTLQPPYEPKGNTPTPSPTPKEKHVAKQPANPPKLEVVAVGWTAEGSAWWVETVGRMTPGRFGKALKPFVDRFGWPSVQAAMIRWCIEQGADGKQLKVEWFADVCAKQLTSPTNGTNPYAGWMDDELERRTRPAGFKP